MNEFYQPCDEAISSSYVNCNRYDDADHWQYMTSCHCLECYEDFSSTHNSIAYNPYYCNCENCCYHDGKYEDGQKEYFTNTYETTASEYSLGEPEYLRHYEPRAHYLYGKYNFSLDKNSNKSFLRKANGYGMPYFCNKHGNYINNNGVTSRNIQLFNAISSAILNDAIQCSLKNIGVTKPKPDPKFNDDKAVSVSHTEESFHSCAPCDSTQLQMVYKNNKQVFSKSTINQSSIQTIGSKPSNAMFKKKKFVKKNKKTRINSGYFEFISPTQNQSKDVFKSVSLKKSVETVKLTSHCVQDSEHYGYFEVKEKDYASNNKEQSKLVSFSELDKVPVKISKEVDTTHLKESIMLDKCLSADIKQNTVKTSDKSLTADMGMKEHSMLSQTDILKIFSSWSKYYHSQVKKSSKVSKSISNESLTNFKMLGKVSVTKQNNSTHSMQSKAKVVGSLSEGSINMHKKVYTERDIKRSEKKIISKKETRESYKTYLDTALDKLESQISNKIETTLSTYVKKKPLVTIYKTTTESFNKPNNISHSNSLTPKNGIITSYSPTTQTFENVIDSEDADVDTNDLDGRSSLSSPSNSCNYKSYNSDVSSYNTERINIDDTLECVNERRGRCIRAKNQVNSYGNETKFGKNNNYNSTNEKPDFKEGSFSARETACKYAIISQENIENFNTRNMHDKFADKISKNVAKGKNSEEIENRRNKENYNLNVYSYQVQEDDINRSKYRQKNASILKQKYPVESKTTNRSSNTLNPSSYSQRSDIKTRGNYERVRFKDVGLGTIKEEYEPQLSNTSLVPLMYKDKSSTARSNDDMYRSVMSIEDTDRNRLESSNTANISSSGLQIYRDISGIKSHEKTPSYQSNSRRNFKDYSKTHSSISRQQISDHSTKDSKRYKNMESNTSFFSPQTSAMEDFIDENYCKRQICWDCPKKRYYSGSDNRARVRHYEERNYDKLCDYMSDVPLYERENETRTYDYDVRDKHTKLLNMISFVVFIVVFFGIFQYIDSGIRNGKFPWI